MCPAAAALRFPQDVVTWVWRLVTLRCAAGCYDRRSRCARGLIVRAAAAPDDFIHELEFEFKETLGGSSGRVRDAAPFGSAWSVGSHDHGDAQVMAEKLHSLQMQVAQLQTQAAGAPAGTKPGRGGGGGSTLGGRTTSGASAVSQSGVGVVMSPAAAARREPGIHSPPRGGGPDRFETQRPAAPQPLGRHHHLAPIKSEDPGDDLAGTPVRTYVDGGEWRAAGAPAARERCDSGGGASDDNADEVALREAQAAAVEVLSHLQNTSAALRIMAETLKSQNALRPLKLFGITLGPIILRIMVTVFGALAAIVAQSYLRRSPTPASPT